MFAYVLAALIAVCTPWLDWRWRSDRRNYDGERYTEYCVGQYQIPETWTCVEVPIEVRRKGHSQARMPRH